MVNFNFNFASLAGIALIGLALFLLITAQGKANEIFLAMFALLSGSILTFQGWRYDPVMQFSQLLSVVIVIYYTIETIHLRRKP